MKKEYKGLGYDFRKVYMNIRELKKAQKELDTENIQCPKCKEWTKWKIIRDWTRCLDCVKKENTNEFSMFYKNK